MAVNTYCTVAQVASFISMTISASTVVTTDEETEFIERIAAKINGILRKEGITGSAITDDDSLAILENINVLGAAWLTYAAMTTKAIPNASDRAAEYRDDYEKELEKLEESPDMISATGVSPVMPRNYPGSGFAAFARRSEKADIFHDITEEDDDKE